MITSTLKNQLYLLKLKIYVHTCTHTRSLQFTPQRQSYLRAVSAFFRQKTCMRTYMTALFEIANVLITQTTQMPINRQMSKLIVVYSCNGILHNKKEQTTDTFNHMNELHRHRVEWEKSDIYAIYMNFKNRQNDMVTQIRFMVTQEIGSDWRVAWGIFQGCWKCSMSWSVCYLHKNLSNCLLETYAVYYI